MVDGVVERPQSDPGCPSCVVLREELADLREVVEKLGAEVTRLKGRKPTTSRTSSKPPSSDGPWSKAARRKKSPSGKKRGGQPGHKGQRRRPAPPEDVNEVKAVKPSECRSCSAPLAGDDPSPRVHQVVDIPPITPHVLEYRLHELECSTCGTSTRASLPEDVSQSSFGPNLSGLIATLTGGYRMSRRSVQRFVADSYGIDISLGALSGVEARISEGLAGAHADAMASVAESPVKHLDETSWTESNKSAWVWTAVGEDATVFVIRDTRGSVVARELIGDDPTGIVVTDRYSGYLFIALGKRQICLAHLIRDFRQMAEGQEDLRWIGERLLGLINALFRIWHMHLDEDIDRATLQRWARSIRVRMIRLLDEGARSIGYETPSMCRGILKTEPAIWTFVDREGVEPTNNVAERAVRPAVISRKTSYGTQSERGSRFVERMLTCSATLRCAGRSLSAFINGVAHAVLAGGPLPKLLS